MVLKMYVKPFVKQRFAVAFSPCAKTLNSLGKSVFRRNGERGRETLIKPGIFCVSGALLGKIEKKVWETITYTTFWQRIFTLAGNLIKPMGNHDF